MSDEFVQIIAALVSALAIIITLITAVTSTRSSAFNDLKTVVERMEKQLESNRLELEDNRKTISDLRDDFSRERRLRMQYEDYIHALIGQLRAVNILPVEMAKYVEDITTMGDK